MRSRSRRTKQLVFESFARLHEHFVHDGVVYRFDARPTITVLGKRARRVVADSKDAVGTKVSAMLAFLFGAQPAINGVWAGYLGWRLYADHYWEFHNVLPAREHAWMIAHHLPALHDILDRIIDLLPS